MNPQLPTARRLNLHYIAMQVGFWAMYAAICAYMTALLLARGFTNSEAGVLTAIRCLAGIFCQPILGGFADRHPNVPLRLIVSLSLGLSLVAGALFYLTPMGMSGTAIVFFVIGGFELAAYPLMDSMAIQYINVGVPIRYSLGRGIGSMSYAVCCVLLGYQVGQLGLESTLVTHVILVGVEIVLVASYPVFHAQAKLPGQEEGDEERPHSVFWLLKHNPRFTLMLLAVLCGITGVLPLANFLVNIVVDRGGATEGLGLALFLMAGAELPTAFFFQRLMRRYGSGRLMLLGLFFCAVKAGAFLAAPNLFWIYLIQPIQMVGYGLYTPTSVYYVNESVPVADRVKGQTIMMVASNGLGGMLGSLAAGKALDWGETTALGGVNAMLVFCTAICALGVVLALLSVWGSKRPDEDSYLS